MASCESLPPSLTFDSSDHHRESASMALDLNRLDALFQASSHIQQSLKGKNVASSVVVPIQVPEGSSSISATALDLPDARVPPRKIDLGISSSGHKPVTAQPSASSITPSWTNIVQNKMVQSLEFVQPIITDNILKIPFHLLNIGRKKYSLCLIGQFMGSPPKMGLIQAMAMRLWGRQSPVSVVPYTEGLYLPQFSDESSLTRALYGGPWHIGGIPLLLRKWEAGIGLVDFSTSLIPVWVQHKKVPFELLTKEGLSYLLLSLMVVLALLTFHTLGNPNFVIFATNGAIILWLVPSKSLMFNGFPKL
ncbi:hypothetical protein Tsubulata_032485 [Turnera subulata]|uniref:DUF4283 domain-containing protein n=1 Tax=Turnera subulata TaxID=218843 RepID=A0A9Q0FHR3_9ROSI|nr:hypothetical protein Tsubulata_032485 [Turnera subulata]